MNPLLNLDYPDPDVIRVDDTYYMISTTMYFMPGGEILKSKDLINWEHACFVYDTLDGTDAQRLIGGKNIYSAGMWAATLRYHKGTYYVMFVCNDTKKTYLYRAEDINGPWKKSCVEGFYHDCSLLFDDDDRVYVVYGNREIYLTELNDELTGPKEGGVHRLIVKDTDKALLGYEGSHFYKINGRYYVFFIHSKEEYWFRTESCYVSDSLDGEFRGGDIFANDIGYCNSGVAQGGIVDTPDGKWYGILFQDRGAVGRIPVLVPMVWEDNSEYGWYPKMCAEAQILQNPLPGVVIKEDKLAGSDDFSNTDGPSFGLKSFWQFNHEPVLNCVKIDTDNKKLILQTDRITDNIVQAVNTVTQKLRYPVNRIEVTVDASEIREGDYAGLVCLQEDYAYVAITKEAGLYYMVFEMKEDNQITTQKVEIDNPVQRLWFEADFENMKDVVKFNIGPDHKMRFLLSHFTGNRAGLFYYSTREAGGQCGFSDFKNIRGEENEEK